MAEALKNDTRLQETLDAIKEGYERVSKAKATRQEQNEIMGEVRAALEAKGIPRKAFARAIEAHEMDEDKRDHYDLAYQTCRKALGAPVKDDVDLIEWIRRDEMNEDVKDALNRVGEE